MRQFLRHIGPISAPFMPIAHCSSQVLIAGLALALVVKPALAAISASVGIHAADVRATMSATGIGLNTSPYYNNLSHPNVDDRLAEAGVATLRYGGGGYADVLHWCVQYLELLAKDFLSDSSALVRGSAFFGVSLVHKLIKPNESFVRATSSHNQVRAHPALKDEGSLAVMILNLDPTETADVLLDVEWLQLGSTGARFALVGGTNLTENVISGLSNSFMTSVAARSISPS